jgi:hypothetical protein
MEFCLSFPISSLGTLLAGEALLRHLIAPWPHEKPLYHRDFKSYTAKSLIVRLEQDQKTWVLNQLQYCKQPTKTKSAYQVWQEGFHPQQIISGEMLHQKINYLHHNLVCIGVVEWPED